MRKPADANNRRKLLLYLFRHEISNNNINIEAKRTRVAFDRLDRPHTKHTAVDRRTGRWILRIAQHRAYALYALHQWARNINVTVNVKTL